MYKDLPRLFCPHRLGRNRAGELRVLCYQYGGESESGLEPMGLPANLEQGRSPKSSLRLADRMVMLYRPATSPVPWLLAGNLRDGMERIAESSVVVRIN
jgi:hypothetical protein